MVQCIAQIPGTGTAHESDTNVQILRSAQDDSEAKRVILSGAKDLYLAF